MEQNWQFFLANTEDMSKNADITPFSRNNQLQIGKNKGGQFSFSVPMNSITVPNTDTNAHCVICNKNNVTRWSGPLLTKVMNFDNETIDLTAVGWFETLLDRFIEKEIPGPYNSPINLGTIAFDLLELANDDHTTYISAGSNSCTTLYKPSPYESWMSIGEEIVSLSELESGFDFEVDPSTRELNISNWDEYELNTSVSFGYNWGSDNLQTFTYTEDGGAMRNKTWGVGETVAIEQTDDGSVADNKLLKTEVILLNETDDNDYLSAIVESNLVVKSDPQIIIGFDCKPYSKEGGNPYSIFEDFKLGDKTKIVAKIMVEDYNGEDFAVTVKHDIRIFGLTIEISSEGNETLKSVETTYQGQ